MTIAVEMAGGLAVILGLFVPLASIPMIAVLLVAIFTVHLPNGFSSIKLESFTSNGAHFGQPGYETDLLYIAGLLALVVGGTGPGLSIGSWLATRVCRGSRRIARSISQRTVDGDRPYSLPQHLSA